LEPSPTERPLKVPRLKYLQTRAEMGELITFHWARAKMGDKVLRMNGQHSSTMLEGLNGNLPGGLKVHLDTYEVDSPDALALLFRQFDARQSSRSPAMSLVPIKDSFQSSDTSPRRSEKWSVRLLPPPQHRGHSWHA
jgi:hypothetical protein